MEMPRQVRRALALLWVSLVAGIVISILEAAPLEYDDDPWWKWFFWGVFALGYGIIAVLLAFIARRHNWARWVLLAITFLGLALMLYPWEWMTAETYAEMMDPSTVVIMIMDFAGLYWLFSGPGAAWYKTR
jgi:peptidoglycan/LPS O-acetylase OafA/YrhL